MPAVGKEIERPISQETVVQPVEQSSYVEKVEKQVETQQQANIQPQQPKKTSLNTDDMGKVVSAQFAVQTKPQITLPLNQQQMNAGLHQGVWKGIRWASEWCLMMIKKYPGRVFYLSPETEQ
ncbi:MAG TPA: hypothetical protein PLI45_04030 [Candidatus Woesebacteria bacterium]|nr:hypothetical protein [Candidatus Woesebacteria bacterium]